MVARSAGNWTCSRIYSGMVPDARVGGVSAAASVNVPSASYAQTKPKPYSRSSARERSGAAIQRHGTDDSRVNHDSARQTKLKMANSPMKKIPAVKACIPKTKERFIAFSRCNVLAADFAP